MVSSLWERKDKELQLPIVLQFACRATTKIRFTSKGKPFFRLYRIVPMIISTAGTATKSQVI